ATLTSLTMAGSYGRKTNDRLHRTCRPGRPSTGKETSQWLTSPRPPVPGDTGPSTRTIRAGTLPVPLAAARSCPPRYLASSAADGRGDEGLPHPDTGGRRG